jgi:hypothetical protein
MRDSWEEFLTVFGILVASLVGAMIAAHFGPYF